MVPSPDRSRIYDFAIDNNLKGIGIWALGYDGDNTELWSLLYSKFGDEIIASSVFS